MTIGSNVPEMEKRQLPEAEGIERTRKARRLIPLADIYETDDAIVVVADVPGANPESADITLENDVLKIEASVNPDPMDGYSLAWAEYVIGDYERSFALSDRIDRDGIEAELKDGVLRLVLPKAGPAKARKIQVKSG